MDGFGPDLNPFKALVLGSSPSRPTSIDFRRRPVTSRKCDKTRENRSTGGILTSSDVQGGSWAAR